ncbi:MAG: hypothetical protein MHM6MM_006051 [Cercozoa sp. M6MM]
MGNLLGKAFGKPNREVLMMGPRSAGKTTILYKIKLNEVVSSTPTIGFSVENLDSAALCDLPLKVWDIGGGYHRPSQQMDAIIFVVDSTNGELLDQNSNREQSAADKLRSLLSADDLEGVPLLVFANKQDQSKALSIKEITERLELSTLRNRNWHIQASCALTGDGLCEGFDWLASSISC